jgi:transposase-like protein
MTRHTDTVEVIVKDQRRRRWSPEQKATLVRRTYEPGMSVSLMARQEGVSASLLFLWRKLERQGALTAVYRVETLWQVLHAALIEKAEDKLRVGRDSCKKPQKHA